MTITLVIDDLVVIPKFVCLALFRPRCQRVLIAFNISQASR